MQSTTFKDVRVRQFEFAKELQQKYRQVWEDLELDVPEVPTPSDQNAEVQHPSSDAGDHNG